MVGALVEDVAAGLGRKLQPTFGYYRQPNGDITISPVTRMEKLKYEERGWEHLARYGAFDMTPYVANHKFEGLLMMGGVHELSTRQLIETGMYFNPPRVPTCKQHITQYHRAHTSQCWVGAKLAVFPQMKEVPSEQLGPFTCEFCDRRIPTAQGLAQHQSVAHRDEQARLQTGRSMGQSLAAVLSGSPGSNGNQEVERLASQVATMERRIRELTARPKRPRKAKSLKQADKREVTINTLSGPLG